MEYSQNYCFKVFAIHSIICVILESVLVHWFFSSRWVVFSCFYAYLVIFLLNARHCDGEGNGTPLQYSCLENPIGWRSLVGCSPWGRYESDTTERLHFHFSLSCIGEGNGNLLQCSCLENPRDGGAWSAAVSGVAQSRTWLKRLSSISLSRGSLVLHFLP